MQKFTQDNRSILISDFGLGKDVFLLSSFNGKEAISDLFQFEITVLSENLEVSPQDIVGNTATIFIKMDSERYFHGHVSHFTYGEMKSYNLREYKMTMVPWLWFLSKNNNHRIFQEKNTKEIVSEVFTKLGINDFVFQAEGGLTREYCVQHNESDFHFISRLLEEEGIAYHFIHENGKHTMVLSDDGKAYQECAEANLE